MLCSKTQLCISIVPSRRFEMAPPSTPSWSFGVVAALCSRMQLCISIEPYSLKMAPPDFATLCLKVQPYSFTEPSTLAIAPPDCVADNGQFFLQPPCNLARACHSASSCRTSASPCFEIEGTGPEACITTVSATSCPSPSRQHQMCGQPPTHEAGGNVRNTQNL